MRLIDADECEKYFYNHLTDAAMAGAMNAIDEMPTIEPLDSVLDKIKEEIFLLSDSKCDGHTVTIYSWSGMQRKVLDIIDKYSVK